MPTNTDVSKGPQQLTTREIEVLVCSLRSVKDGFDSLKIDYDKLAELASLKNARSAATTWLNLKKKLFGESAGGADKPATPRKKKRAATPDDEDMKDIGLKTPPAKKIKRPSTPHTQGKVEKKEDAGVSSSESNHSV